MHYEFKKLLKSEIEIEVTLIPPEFEFHITRAAALLSEEHEIEGFRRGKAPYEIVEKRFGEGMVLERAAELAVKKTYPEVMQKLIADGKIATTHPPIGRPEVEIRAVGKKSEFIFRVKVALLPSLDLPGYKEIAGRVIKEKKKTIVSDEEVAKAVDWLLESRTTIVTVERPAAAGDRVEVDFEIRQDGVKIAGGDSQNHPLILGKGKFLPGFEEELFGMKAGDEKEITIKVPEGWHEKAVAGKTLDIKTEMKLVQERAIPELNEEFAKNIGNFDSLEALRENIREGLKLEKEEKEIQRIRARIADEIADGATGDIPDVLVASELDKMVADVRTNATQMGMKWEEYLAHIKKTEDDLRKDWKGDAERRVRVALCLREIAMNEHIEADDMEVERRAGEFLRQFQTAEDAAKTIDPDDIREYTRGVVRNEKVFEFLEKI